MEQSIPQHRIKRGDNHKGFATKNIAVRVDQELAALDRLGPATRQAIVNAPIKYSAYTVILEVQRQEKVLSEKAGYAVELDLSAPDLDRFLALEVLKKAAAEVSRDRSREDALASITPLQGKPSPRSVREQRRAMRRIPYGARR